MPYILIAFALWSGFIYNWSYKQGYNAKATELLDIARDLQSIYVDARARHQTSVSREVERRLRLQTALKVVDKYPGLKDCVVPADVVEAVDSAGNP